MAIGYTGELGYDLRISDVGLAELDDAPATFLCSTGGSCGAVTDPLVPYVTPDLAFQRKRATIPPARPDLLGSGYRAYAVAVCFCPDYNGCVQFSPDYVQQAPFKSLSVFFSRPDWHPLLLRHQGTSLER